MTREFRRCREESNDFYARIPWDLPKNDNFRVGRCQTNTNLAYLTSLPYLRSAFLQIAEGLGLGVADRAKIAFSDINMG